ncbi:hypothetical protein ACM66B_000499 [Microbotryomycetes sp. NB124-2]
MQSEGRGSFRGRGGRGGRGGRSRGGGNAGGRGNKRPRHQGPGNGRYGGEAQQGVAYFKESFMQDPWSHLE